MNYMLNGNVLIIHLIAGQIKKILYKMSYYPKPDSCGRRKIKVELDFSNCATKSDVKKQMLIH